MAKLLTQNARDNLFAKRAILIGTLLVAGSATVSSIDRLFENDPARTTDGYSTVQVTQTKNIPSPTSSNPTFLSSSASATRVIVPSRTAVIEPPKIYAQISCADRLYFVSLRRSPGYTNKNDNADIIYEVPCGENVELLGDTAQADGLTWWRVEWNGYRGWMADHTRSAKTILIFDP